MICWKSDKNHKRGKEVKVLLIFKVLQMGVQRKSQILLPVSLRHKHAYCTNILALVPVLSAAAPEQKRGRRESSEWGAQTSSSFFPLMHVLHFFISSGILVRLCEREWLVMMGSHQSYTDGHTAGLWDTGKLNTGKRKQNQCGVRRESWLRFKAAQAISQLSVHSFAIFADGEGGRRIEAISQHHKQRGEEKR